MSTLDDECTCGSCPSCRRALKEFDKAMGPDYFKLEYSPSMFIGGESEKATVRHDAYRELMAGVPKPKKPQGERKIAPVALTEEERRERRNKLKREARKRFQAERIKMENGRWFHPRANHGTTTAYFTYGCQCDPCTEVGTARLSLRDRTK